MRNQLVGTVVLAVAMLVPWQARSQERDPAAAQALFDEAQALMNAKRYPEACAKLAESLRLDPGIGTQFHLAACHEHEGKLASAWAAFLEVASLSVATGQDARAKAAKRRAALLEPRLPRLKVVVPAPARASGLEITRDGVLVGEAQWELALPVDPGDHQVEVTAPGRKAFAGAVNAAEGATASFEVPPLEAAAGDASPPPTPVAATPTAPASVSPGDPAPVHGEPAAASREASSGPPALAIVLGIGGVVAIGAGSVLGLVASSKKDESKKHCRPEDENACNPQGVDLRDDARQMGNLATLGFALGGAALVTAAVLWLTSGSDETASADAAGMRIAASPTGASIALRGAF